MPFPPIASVGSLQPAVVQRFDGKVIDLLHIGRASRLASSQRRKDAIDVFAMGNSSSQRVLRASSVPSGVGLQVFGLFRGENFRLFGERDEIIIVAQMISRLLRSLAPAYTVGKVQAQHSTAQIEFKSRFALVRMHHETL